ncbi:MAG: hypothetical protein K0Q95_2473 [Bacteroidota bacterium]|jgi:hypothetical protein|nr:hypothetical protein [Bacteroidota bacterium]
MKSLKITHLFKTKPEVIFPHFLEFEKFGAFHPYFKKVTKTGLNVFHVNEQVLLLGFIPMKPEYKVEVEESNGCVIYKSKVRTGVDLTIKFSFEPKGDHTLLTETVDVEANPIIAYILLKTIQKAHLDLFKRLESSVNIK